MRRKPVQAAPEGNSLEGWSNVIREEGERQRAERTHDPARVERPYPTSLAERLEQAKVRLAAAETIVEATYWQGAVDAFEAFSAGAPMPETIGAGVKAAPSS